MELDNQNKNTEKAIIRVIAFFDMFDYPLTAFEIWKHLEVECELGEVVEVLNSLLRHSREGGNLFENPSVSKAQTPDHLFIIPSPLRQSFAGQAGGGSVEDDIKKHIEKQNGFYFLKGREKNIKTRLRRYNYTDKKFKRAIWVSQIFKLIPWIKGIAIGNIIGSHNLKADGDIDFFIITQKDRIWITRFYCILVTKILGLRPKPGKMKDKICLSFFISEDRLNLQDLTLPFCHSGRSEESLDPSCQSIGTQNDGESDIYFIHWLAGLVPIYDSKNIFEKFFQENNWLKEYLPNWQSNDVHFKREAKEKCFCRIFKKFGGIGDKVFKSLQLKMMSADLKKILNKDTRVIMNDQILKLHVNDRREEYRRKFLNYNL